jgi:hypothetical protein
MPHTDRCENRVIPLMPLNCKLNHARRPSCYVVIGRASILLNVLMNPYPYGLNGCVPECMVAPLCFHNLPSQLHLLKRDAVAWEKACRFPPIRSCQFGSKHPKGKGRPWTCALPPVSYRKGKFALTNLTLVQSKVAAFPKHVECSSNIHWESEEPRRLMASLHLDSTH